MTTNKTELIQKAISCLKLQDILLYESTFKRPDAVAASKHQEGLIQHKRGVQYTIGKFENDGEQKDLLEILVSLGTRVVQDISEESPPVLFFIEAEFLVQYEIIKHLEGDACKAFAENNAIHNVWPFWRQHVYDVVERARLPHIDIPLFSGQKL